MRRMLAMLAVAGFVCSPRGIAGEPPVTKLEPIHALLETGDSFQAFEQVEAAGSPLEVAQRYAQLTQELFARKRNVPRMLQVGQAGIAYALRQSRELAASDPPTSQRLVAGAKALAYNLSANAWPGWEEPGVTITRSDSLAALDAARLNLRLAQQLQRDDRVLGDAYWLLGAQSMALGTLPAAANEFALAEKHYRAAGAADAPHMAAGYAAIVRLMSDSGNAAARAALQAQVAALDKIASDDSRFFARQLESVAKFFAR